MITESAARLGLHLTSLDRFRCGPDPARPALALGYGNLADPAVDEAVALLARVITGHRKAVPGRTTGATKTQAPGRPSLSSGVPRRGPPRQAVPETS